MQKTHTKQGLNVTVKILDNAYQTGRKVCQSFRDNITIVFDEFLSKWNYTAIQKKELIK